MKKIIGQLPWLAPIIISLLISVFQVYGLIDRVNTLEEYSRTRGDTVIQQLQDINSRVKRIEEFCCGEIIDFEQYYQTQLQSKIR